MRFNSRSFLAGAGSLLFLYQPVYALDQIIHPYQSVRSVGMGGVRMTTGLYDENFFNNPARVTANPKTQFTVFQIAPAEVNSETLTIGSMLLSGKSTASTLSAATGNNIHDRTQLILPAYYLAANETRKWALAVGLIASIQSDSDFRQSYQASLTEIADVTPAVTWGMKFLPDDALSVGITGRFAYRLGSNTNYGLLNYLTGSSLGITSIDSDGTQANFDLGATYRITRWGEFEINCGGAIQNILGGNYSTTPISLSNSGSTPPPQPRSYGLGFSLTRSEWWKLSQTVFAIEMTDVLNNSNGTVLRLLHLGAETHWRSLAFRVGLNQGYISGGIGLNVHYFTMNLATYGEELTLYTGGLEDRRYTFDIGVHI